MSLNNPVNEYLATKINRLWRIRRINSLRCLEGALESIAKATGAPAADNAMVLGESLGKAAS